MNTLAGALKKLVLPLSALLLTLAVIVEARGARNGAAGILGLAALTPPKPSAAVVSAPEPPPGVVAEGRLVTYPGAEVAVAPERPGTVARLLVQEKDHVRRGQLLAELKSDDLRAELAEARARVKEAEADIRFADVDLERAESLLEAKVGTAAAADRARSNRDAAHARRDTAGAGLARLEALLAKTRIVSPLDGVVVSRAIDAGEHVESGDPLLTVADLRRTRIEAEVDEFDADRVALGSPVTVTAEGFAGRRWQGRVEEIPDAVVGRRLKPQDPGRPSDTRVLLVKVALDRPTPLRLGQRVEVAIGRR
ncbi:MAG TPA: efflux RND transporter periplasmic adaptor subunit [Thermoanaerobaculia bacterium]|jgi:RND family efflux transporter MFP subunit|nr:efflux RND transporter periplasmic adaptor subunit [Thermoanaerobaculia bacterium]